MSTGRMLITVAHAARLDAASRELFGRGYAPARLAARIEALAAAERYPTGVSGFVRIELDPDGTERLLPAGVSLYDGYAFRSLQPEAVTVGYDLTLSEAPTSAREAAAQLARRLAERRGAEVAVRCDSAGILGSADDAPLLAIAGRTVLPAPGFASVERRLAVQAVRAAGLELREEAFGRADLPSLDADVVFMDISMPTMNGDEATAKALALKPDLKVICLSMFGDENYYSRMLDAGAKGFLLKDSEIDEVFDAIATVADGGDYFCGALLDSMSGILHGSSRESESLSEREIDVLVGICRGLSNQEIADSLFISKRTVDAHRAKILEKTGCRNTASLVVYAIRNRLVEN